MTGKKYDPRDNFESFVSDVEDPYQFKKALGKHNE